MALELFSLGVGAFKDAGKEVFRLPLRLSSEHACTATHYDGVGFGTVEANGGVGVHRCRCLLFDPPNIWWQFRTIQINGGLCDEPLDGGRNNEGASVPADPS